MGGVYLFGNNNSFGGHTNVAVPTGTPGLTKPILNLGLGFKNQKEAIFFASETDMTTTVETHEVGHTLGLGHFSTESSFAQKHIGNGESLFDKQYRANTSGSGEKYNGTGLMRYVVTPIDAPPSTSVPLNTQVVNLLNANPGEKKQ